MERLTNNLDTFRILFIVKAILTFLVALFFLLYAGLGGFFMNIIDSSNEIDDMPFHPGMIFMIIGGVGFILSVAFGILTLLVSKYIKELRNYNFIFVMAILNCLTGVLGILLGVFTIIELNKPHIKDLFESKGEEG